LFIRKRRHTLGDTVQRSLREILSESHIAAITVAIFIFWFFDAIIQALLPFINNASNFVFTAIVILDIPSSTFQISRSVTFAYLYSAAVNLLAAHILSRWVYRLGPFATLAGYWSKLAWRNHVKKI
jgi:hypothetical protein